MRVVLQRVTQASVAINGALKATINEGLLIFVGIEQADTMDDIKWLCSKIVKMRIFNDDAGVMNLSLQDIGGDALVISQFTLQASTKKGNRPSYINAAKPAVAIPLYEEFLLQMEQVLEKSVGSGSFGADMKVSLLNDGPVTIIVDSKNKE